MQQFPADRQHKQIAEEGLSRLSDDEPGELDQPQPVRQVRRLQRRVNEPVRSGAEEAPLRVEHRLCNIRQQLLEQAPGVYAGLHRARGVPERREDAALEGGALLRCAG